MIKESDFEAAVHGAVLRLRGNANGRHADTLEELITKTHADLIARASRVFTVDLRGLEFMTAACFNVFVTWINIINSLPAEQRYRLEFMINSDAGWQRRSLVTLSSLGSEVVKFA